MRLFSFILLLLPFTSLAQSDCTLVLSGKVTANGQPLPGATVLLTGTRLGAVADVNGSFRISGICPDTYEVHVNFLGYEPLKQEITISADVVRNFKVEESSKTLSEVVIKGETVNVEGTQNFVTLNERQLTATAGKSLGEALREISGVNSISAGASIFKPVIHGVHSNRILILNHGIRQEGQQWGAEHAPEVDPFIASEMTVIKDASAIKYGADALGGVIVVSPAELPQKKGLGGRFNAVGQSNGRGGTVSGMLEGGLNTPGWGWRLQGTGKQVGDYHTPDYVLTNTGTKELDFSASAGYHSKKIGGEVFFSRFQSTIGLLKGTAIASVNDLWTALNAQVPQYTAPFSYKISEPRQEVVHDLLKANLHHSTETSEVNLQYGLQLNSRKEFNIRRGAYSELPVIDLDLTTHTIDGDWQLIRPTYRLTFGANGMIQKNVNNPGTLRIPFIPNFTSVSGGPFAVSRFFVNDWTLDFGIRYDYRYYDVAGYDFKNTLFSDQLSFQNVSSTAGATLKVSDNRSLSFNVSTAWRPPHVAELYSLGTHQSAAANEYGFLLNDSTSEVRKLEDVDFNIEKAVKFVTTYRHESSTFRYEATAYANYIFNYIYLKPIGITQTLTAALPALKYSQTDALFLGLDLTGERKLGERWSLASKASLLRASDVTNRDYLVYIPSNRFEVTGRYEIPQWKSFAQIFAETRVRYTMKQTRAPREITEAEWIAAGQSNANLFKEDGSNFDFMAAPAGYFLWNAAIGAAFPGKNARYEARVSVENLLNSSYREYTNRFRYFADEIGRNVTVSLRCAF